MIGLLKKDPRVLKRTEFKQIVMFEQGVSGEDKSYTYLNYEAQSLLCIFNYPFVRYLVFYILVSFGGSFVSNLWYLMHLYDVAVFPFYSAFQFKPWITISVFKPSSTDQKSLKMWFMPS